MLMRHGEIVVLALLADGPRHAYELNKAIDAMQARQWAKLGASTVYRVIDRLEKRGWVRVENRQIDQRPQRKIAVITMRGREALQRFVIEGLQSRAPIYSDRLVAALFADPNAPDVAAAIEECKARLKTSRAALLRARAAPNLSEQGRVIVDFQAACIEAEYEAVDALARTARRRA